MKPILTLFILQMLAACPAAAQPNSWDRTEHSLALMNGSNIVWKIVADPAQGKPYFHPLATPGGTLLTTLPQKDHPWHRGLWWSWKFINGINYWEEDWTTRRSEAATELTACQFEPHEDGSARLIFDLSYHPWNAAPVMTEKRTVHLSAPTNGSYEILWESAFTAITHVTMARTSPSEEPNGKAEDGHAETKAPSVSRYGGLSLRLDAASRNWTFTNSEGISGETSLHGAPAAWVKFSAGKKAPSVTIYDDPNNLRYPSLWYVSQKMPFFSPTLFFENSLVMSPGEKLILHYRIVITDHDLGDEFHPAAGA